MGFYKNKITETGRIGKIRVPPRIEYQRRDGLRIALGSGFPYRVVCTGQIKENSGFHIE